MTTQYPEGWRDALEWRDRQIDTLQRQLRIARHALIDREDTIGELQRRLREATARAPSARCEDDAGRPDDATV